MKAKKWMAMILATTMVFGSSVSVFAEGDPAGTGTSGGSGAIEGVVNTSVYSATLPTESATAFNYKADPQGLIAKTAGEALGDHKTFEPTATVLFTNAAETKTYDFSSISDPQKVVNMSSKNLSVSVSAKATPGTAEGDAALATAKTFESTDTAAKIYLGITDNVEGSTERALTAEGVEMTAVLGAAPEDAYEYTYDADATNKYQYKLVDNAATTFDFAEYAFQINGAANSNATWKADTAVPSIEVTWTVDLTDDDADIDTPEQTAAEPGISLTGSYSRASSENTFALTGITGASITKVEALNSTGAVFAELDSTMYTINGTSLVVDGTKAPWGAGAVGQTRGIKVSFGEDDTTVETTFTVNE